MEAPPPLCALPETNSMIRFHPGKEEDELSNEIGDIPV
jgi:hypothetical protein